MSNTITNDQIEAATALIRKAYVENEETCGFEFDVDNNNNFFLDINGYQIEEDISEFIYDDNKMFEWTKMIIELGIEFNEEL